MKTTLLAGLAIVLAATATPVQAGEVFGGLYVHGVDTPLSLGGSPEGGVDLQLGYRGNRMKRAGLEPYIFVSANSEGDTHFAAVGLSRKFGDRVYIRPGLGIAIHSGSSRGTDRPDNNRIEFGSRVLFEPELGIGARISERVTIEASWIHLSHATVFGKQNPGLDSIGARLNFKL